MKLLHTADWHLGKVIYARSMLEEQIHFIDNCLFPLIENERPDITVLAGDIFDRRIAPPDAIKLFDGFLNRMADSHLPLCAVTGNHDGAERLVLGTRLLKNCGIHIAVSPEDCFTPVRFDDEYGSVFVYMLPYFEPSQIRALFNDDDIRGFSKAYEVMLGRIRERMDKSARNVLVTHCFVSGGIVNDSESPIYIGGSGEVPSELFDDFDYVALGHLHSPQRAGKRGRYSGSPLKYSFDEAVGQKAVLTVELGAKGEPPTVTRHAIAPLHDMRVISGTMEELLQNGSDDFVYAELTDNVPVFEPMARLREKYPNILGLSNAWLKNGGAREELRRDLNRVNGDGEIIDQFFRQICNEELNEEEKQLMADIYKESMGRSEGGTVDETD